MANSIGCIAVSTTSSFERRDRSESGSLLAFIPRAKVFHGYLITADGEIYNKKGEKKYTWLNKGREALYERVQLWIDGKKKNFYVHRLVAQMFLPGWDPEFIVNHMDGNTLNNAVWNLELGNQSYNIYEAYYKKEYYLKVGKIHTNVLARVATNHAVQDNKRLEF